MEPASYEICSLDTNNPSEVMLYEKALYRAFAPTLTNTSHLIFNIDHKKKCISTKIPYASQFVFVLKWAEALVGGIAVNFNMENTLQLELLNFKIESRQNACEGLVLFSLLDFMNSIPAMRKLSDFFISEIKKRNISTVYSTSSKKRAAGYKLLGFQVIDQYDFDGQGKCLLRLIV